jgi:hypothetical protein
MPMAGKISEVSPDRCLSTKMAALQWKAPEMPPQFLLGIGHVAAQPARGRDTAIRLTLYWLHLSAPHP